MIDGYFCYTPAYNLTFTPIVQAYRVTSDGGTGYDRPFTRTVEPLTSTDNYWTQDRRAKDQTGYRPPTIENNHERYNSCIQVGTLIDRYDTDQ